MVAQINKTQKQVVIIARYTFKNSDRICYKVRSSDGVGEYHTCQDHGRWTCTCKGWQHSHKCYHVVQLEARETERNESQKQGNTSPATAEIVNVTMGTVTISEPISNLGNAVAHHIWAKKMLAGVKEDEAEKAEREARLQREADAMVEQAHRKYDAPLNGNRGFSLLRV